MKADVSAAKDCLSETDAQHWRAFVQHGMPSRKNEYWKYDDVSFLADKHYSLAQKIDAREITEALHQHSLRSGDGIFLVMINGYFMPELSDLFKLPAGIIACSLQEALQKQGDDLREKFTAIDNHKYPFASLNADMFTDGLFLQVADDCKLHRPIHLLSIMLNEENIVAYPHNLILTGKNTEITLFEEYFGASQNYLMNTVNTIHLDEAAIVTHYKLQQEAKSATHMACHFISQEKNSRFSHVNISAGAQFARDDVVVHLRDTSAECHTSGYYHLRDKNQTIDNHIDIRHAAAHSQSNMLYKGIVANQARAIFNGRLHVEKDAQHIQAYQGNHNLLVDKQAEVYSKPELEIYADNVKCKHGATTGQINRDALFYLRSRGIAEQDAIEILLQAFADEIMQRVTHAGIRMRMQEVL